MIPVTMWMNVPSPHQTDLMTALVRSGEVDLEVVFARRLTADRLGLGWKDSLGPYAYRFLDEQHPLAHAAAMAWHRRQRVHIVNGIWAEPAFPVVLGVLGAYGSSYLVYAEAPNPHTSRSIGARFVRWSLGKLAARRSAGALAISHFGVEYYGALGFPETGVYPFGYFENPATQFSAPRDSTDDDVREILYVGQMISRKGVDCLIDAAAKVLSHREAVRLCLVGDGPLRSEFRAQAIRLGISNRVDFEGVLPIDRIFERIRRAEVLVLPSRWDGWGMVVNEALSTGVPVIVSDQCGAVDLVCDGENGYVFRAEDAEHLAQRLSQVVTARPEERRRLRAGAWRTGQLIAPPRAAEYLIECLWHLEGRCSEPPRVPWAGRVQSGVPSVNASRGSGDLGRDD